jgi:hypothetical protein
MRLNPAACQDGNDVPEATKVGKSPFFASSPVTVEEIFFSSWDEKIYSPSFSKTFKMAISVFRPVVDTNTKWSFFPPSRYPCFQPSLCLFCSRDTVT